MVWFWTLGSVALVSVLSVIGIIFLAYDRVRLQKILLFLVSFAIGGLAGDAFIHLIPQSLELNPSPSTSLLIISGMLLFFTMEKFIRWRHCHIPTSENHVHPVAVLNLIGDGIHNFIDGILIGASYLVSIPIGITTTLAVVLHEIPQEIGDFGVLVHAGFTVRKALFYNFLSALTAVAGGSLAIWIGPQVTAFSTIVLPIAAGGFIYIAGSDLIPELQQSCERLHISFLQLASILLGIALMFLFVLFE
ncbi:MAG: ZIP family metal transporter [Dehalococcoidia bacterium]|nr:ZIP family metal transporter [Dehalococcoidia bacterium]